MNQYCGLHVTPFLRPDERPPSSSIYEGANRGVKLSREQSSTCKRYYSLFGIDSSGPGDPAAGELPVDSLLAPSTCEAPAPVFTDRTGISDLALVLAHPNASSTLDTRNL